MCSAQVLDDSDTADELKLIAFEVFFSGYSALKKNLCTCGRAKPILRSRTEVNFMGY